VVLDREVFPRNKICAGWVTPQIFQELSIEPAEYASSGRLLQPMHGFTVQRIGSPRAVVDHGQPVSYAIRRYELDHYLLDRCGARTVLGTRIQSLEGRGSGWRVETDQGTIHAGSLLGAGGHFCPVARHLGARPGRSEPTIVATEIEFQMSPDQRRQCEVQGLVPELYFSEDLLGYGWAVRKGDDWLNVGVGRVDTGGFPEHVQQFLEWLRGEHRVPRDLPRMQGHAYLLHDQAPRPLSGPGALLLGDAAGLAYNPSGEGIRPAVESGLLAAGLIARQGRVDSEVEKGYEDAIVRRFGPRLHGALRPSWTQRIPEAWRGPLAGRVLAFPWFARNVVVDRWFLHRQQPPLPV
jgi:flavin-dependent dehydrogenase